MVVVLIIGILVAIAIPVFNAASRAARLRTCHSNQRTIEGAAQQWLAADPNNTWVADIIDGSDVLTTSAAYIKDVPNCPETGGSTYSTNVSGTVNGDTGAAAYVAGHGHF